MVEQYTSIDIDLSLELTKNDFKKILNNNVKAEPIVRLIIYIYSFMPISINDCDSYSINGEIIELPQRDILDELNLDMYPNINYYGYSPIYDDNEVFFFKTNNEFFFNIINIIISNNELNKKFIGLDNRQYLYTFKLANILFENKEIILRNLYIIAKFYSLNIYIEYPLYIFYNNLKNIFKDCYIYI